jgi:hypothetical protein
MKGQAVVKIGPHGTGLFTFLKNDVGKAPSRELV